MSQMTDKQYTNIMVALGKLETKMESGNTALEKEQKHTNEHLKTLNSKVATNVLAIKNLEQEDILMKNDLKILIGESTKRQDNTQWWQRHISGIVVSVILGLVLLVLQVSGILSLDI